jgi:excisionase family DNA binding protein
LAGHLRREAPYRSPGFLTLSRTRAAFASWVNQRCPIRTRLGNRTRDGNGDGSERISTMEQMRRNNEPPFLTPPEVARLLRVSPEKVYGWIRRGELRAVNVGNCSRPRYRVSRDNLEAFLAAREVQPPPQRPQRKCQPPDGGPLDPALGEALLKKGQAVKVANKYYRVWKGTILFY